MIKELKKTTDIDEANRLLNQGWVLLAENLNEFLLGKKVQKRKKMNKIVQVELVDVRSMHGLIWANMMLEAGWVLLTVNGLSLLLGAERGTANEYEELREKRDSL